MTSILSVAACSLFCAVCAAVCGGAGTGGLRLLNAAGLSGLLQLLSDRDMPVDMLQLLVYMAEDGCRCVQGSHLGGLVNQSQVIKFHASVGCMFDCRHVLGCGGIPGRRTWVWALHMHIGGTSLQALSALAQPAQMHLWCSQRD